jgi:ABC-type transport system involved in cytochrome c biogenesis permease component
LLLYPLLVPLIISGVEACGLMLSGENPEELWSWIRVMGVADFIFLMGSIALFSWVLRAIE